jgi:hypothetical protein
MFERSIWLCESEDKLRIAPRADRNRSAPSANQRIPRALDRYLIGVCADQECPFFDASFPVIRLIAGETRPLKRAGDIACNMAGRLAECC